MILTLGSGNGAYNVGSPSTQTGTIADNDKVTANVSSLSITEGNTGTKQATAIVLLSAAAPYAITVTMATTATGSTATAGSDYVAASQTLTFAAGVTSQSFSVTINGDTTVEPNEIIRLTATSSTALIGTVGTITILNDDSGPAPLAAAGAPLSTAAPGSATPSAATESSSVAPTPAATPAAAPESATPSAATATFTGARTFAPIAAAGRIFPISSAALAGRGLIGVGAAVRRLEPPRWFKRVPVHRSPARKHTTRRGGHT